VKRIEPLSAYPVPRRKEGEDVEGQLDLCISTFNGECTFPPVVAIVVVVGGDGCEETKFGCMWVVVVVLPS